MEKSVGLESLPYEIIEIISCYLSVQDITACCATSSLLRQAFNSDLVWRRKCNLGLVDYLNKSESLVEPSFEWTELMYEELSTLSPLSNWRKCYMMQHRLFQNWREGRYDREQFEFGKYGVYHPTIIKFYQSDHIFIHTRHITEGREQNEIWDVKESHFLHSTFNLHFKEYSRFLSDDKPHFDVYQIVGDRLVVCKQNLVLIYEINLTSFSSIPLCHAFLFNLPDDDDSNCSVSSGRAQQDQDIPILQQKSTTVCCGNFLVGVVCTDIKFHIWNIQSGKKVAEEVLPLNNIGSINISSTDKRTENIIFVLTSSRSRCRYEYFGYDLKKRKFSSFKLKHNYCDVIDFSGSYVIAAHRQQLFSFSYETSTRVAFRTCNYELLKKTITLVGSKLLCGTSDSTMFVMDPATLCIISSVKLNFTLYSLRTICDKFVLINSINSEVWEIGKTPKHLFKIPCDGSLAAINKHFTKVAVLKNNMVFILNFW